MQPTTTDTRHIVISYLTLRKLLGGLGIMLPVVLFAGSLCMGQAVEGSISAYYYTAMRDLFVGLLCAMALFLFCYKGYDDPDVRISESALANFAGAMALLVALFPTSKDLDQECIGCVANLLGWYQYCAFSLLTVVHLGSAVLFFTVVAYLSVSRFTKITPPEGRESEIRLYRICGYVIYVSLAVMITYFALCETLFKNNDWFLNLPVIFVFETTSLWAFGIAWLRKGKAMDDVKSTGRFIRQTFKKKTKLSDL
jgi:hypothetical protein